MDIFRFDNPTSPTKLEYGTIINGLKSKMWIERYDRAGEFTFVAGISSGAKETLPIGSLVSHTNTKEVMIVENHEIQEERGQEPQVTVTGRGFETFFENRIVGSNISTANSTDYTNVLMPPDYTLASDDIWDQIVVLIRDHVYATNVEDPDDAIPYLVVSNDVPGTSARTPQSLKRGDLYSHVLALLKLDGLGIKVIRPGIWSPLGPGDPNLLMLIHKGIDRRAQVVFSYDTGEIESVDYLDTIKNLKNAAYISGRWIHTRVDLSQAGYDRRVLHVDASDIDDKYTEEQITMVSTSGNAARRDIRDQMRQRGLEALVSHNRLELTKAEVSKDVVKAGYRRDFDVGDLVSVNGDYSTSTARRISEYVEIEDQNGSRSYPTLTTV